MSRRVLILTPDQAGEWNRSRWPDVLAGMATPLEAAGVDVAHRSWTAPIAAQEFDLVLPLLAWGYHRDGDWQGQVRAWETQGLPLQNPAAVLRWNADKLYLQRLAEEGAAIVPTLFVDRIDDEAMTGASRAFGTDRLIAKPRISAGAFQTIRWSPGASIEGGPDGPAMIQPYLPGIETSGEVSLLYFGGVFSHAISKVPQPGDFRVQPEYDGIIARHAPLADELEAAGAALRAVGEDLLYARVDLVRDLTDRPVLMELELVEPDLYLGFDDAAPARFAEAVADATG